MWVGAVGFCWIAAAKACLFDDDSGLIVKGLERGEGFVSRLLASEEPRGGILTILASFLATGVACNTEALTLPFETIASRLT